MCIPILAVLAGEVGVAAFIWFVLAKLPRRWAREAPPLHTHDGECSLKGSHSARGILVYCSDYRCSHSVTLSADRWPDELSLSDLEPRFACKACGRRGADVRPDFNWNRNPTGS